MIIIPAIDLIDKKAVRLEKGDYSRVTVYSEKPWEVAQSFAEYGAEYLHVVDLDGAKSGKTDNLEVIKKIIDATHMRVEVGGGIRNLDTVDMYAECGVSRIILGTAAVTDRDFLCAALKKHGDKIAVGVDIKDGMVAIKGWTEVSGISCETFCAELCELGVRTVICTDISKDGMLGGTNLPLYRSLGKKFSIDFVASGGVSSISDIEALRDMGLYGAIVGKAIYTGALDLGCAIAAAEGRA